MAFTVRTIDTIFQELLTEKISYTYLTDLNTDITDENTLAAALDNTKVAEWVLWLYSTAVAIHLAEVGLQTGIDDINTILENKQVLNEQWYIAKAKEFQFGDTLLIDSVTYQPSYATVDEAAQIIGSATIRTVANQLQLKVRRTDSDILSGAEKTAFEGYMNAIKAAGTRIRVDNFAADEVTLNMTILYKGSEDLTTLQSTVESTINDYLDNIEFDSSIYMSSIIDALQAIDGVIDPRLDSASAIDSLGNETSFTHEYSTNAGYATINSSTPLSSTITYIAK
jgi:hypothetical protein